MSSYRGIRVMNNLSLDGKWDLAYFPEGKIKTKRIVESNGEVLTWIEATVPGNCQLDLMRRNHLPDQGCSGNRSSMNGGTERDLSLRTSGNANG
jgi:hypothetical protein